MKALLKKFIQILFYLNFIKLSLSCYINFWDRAFMNEWRLILTQGQRNQYQLFRGQHVPPNSNIIMMCNRESRLITVHCDARNSLNPPLPLRNNCPENQSIRPARVEDPHATHCPQPYRLYRIGFNIQVGHHRQFLETYQVCFDHRHMRTVFTINEAYAVGGRRPAFRFVPDTIFTNDFFHAFDHQVTVRTFNTLLGATQDKMVEGNLDHVIDRGHLAPSADFTLVNFKLSTFEMINVMPQFRTIDNNNWRLIEEWTRDPIRSPSHVCTGVLDCKLDGVRPSDLNCVVKLQDIRGRWVPMFLAERRKIPIPLWTYKIVKNRERSLVFLTLNNIHHEGVVHAPAGVCQPIECPLRLTQTVQLGFTFCCNYDEFIRVNVPHLREVC